MNKLTCLLLFPFVATQPLAPAPVPAATRLPGQVVLPAAPYAADWALLAGPGRRPATTRPSAIRALGRLLRAYTAPPRPESATGQSSGAPFPPFSSTTHELVFTCAAPPGRPAQIPAFGPDQLPAATPWLV